MITATLFKAGHVSSSASQSSRLTSEANVAAILKQLGEEELEAVTIDDGAVTAAGRAKI